MRTARTAALMALLPPVLLVASAHAGALSHSALASWGILVGAWAAAMAALATSGWSSRTGLLVGLAYTLAAIPLLPFLGLLAVCSTGDCL
jgi:hypothetical protein